MDDMVEMTCANVTLDTKQQCMPQCCTVVLQYR